MKHNVVSVTVSHVDTSGSTGAQISITIDSQITFDVQITGDGVSTRVDKCCLVVMRVVGGTVSYICCVCVMPVTTVGFHGQVCCDPVFIVRIHIMIRVVPIDSAQSCLTCTSVPQFRTDRELQECVVPITGTSGELMCSMLPARAVCLCCVKHTVPVVLSLCGYLKCSVPIS